MNIRTAVREVWCTSTAKYQREGCLGFQKQMHGAKSQKLDCMTIRKQKSWYLSTQTVESLASGPANADLVFQEVKLSHSVSHCLAIQNDYKEAEAGDLRGFPETLT